MNNREGEREREDRGVTPRNSSNATKKGLNQKKIYRKIKMNKRKFGIKESFVAFEEFRSVTSFTLSLSIVQNTIYIYNYSKKIIEYSVYELESIDFIGMCSRRWIE